MNPPKPAPRPDKVSLWRYFRLFRQDILSAQPQRLYRAWMAEFKTPFFRSYLLNQPNLLDTVLRERPMDFPKSNRIAEGLRPLLGNSVFLSNGEVWKRQRRIIDPAFEGGRLRDAFGSVAAAGQAAVARLGGATGPLEVEAVTSHLAADVIFRSLFSIPISDQVATQVFNEFRDYQRSQPILNPAALVPMPRWIPRLHRRKTRAAAARIRALIGTLTAQRASDIANGTAPDDLATKIMTTPDPETGQVFETDEMVDQVAIFFLAGHETSASALSWALYLLALYPEAQERVAKEAAALDETPEFGDLSKLRFTRDVFRETLRLYPPVPMMVREATKAEKFRDRDIAKGAQLVISPWHLHRHERLWDNPNAFDPDRFATAAGKVSAQAAYIPFSAGARVCSGAGFAMMEGTLLLALLVRAFRFSTVAGKTPVPVAHLTVRSKDGIWLSAEPR